MTPPGRRTSATITSLCTSRPPARSTIRCTCIASGDRAAREGLTSQSLKIALEAAVHGTQDPHVWLSNDLNRVKAPRRRRWADRIALSCSASRELLPARTRSRVLVTGNPVRPTLLTGDPEAAIKALEWTGHRPDLPTVYVTGGAQGAAQINELVRGLLPELLAAANVIHQCGRLSYQQTSEHATTLPGELRARYQLREFVGPELPDVLALADVVISRSGAGTLAELTTLGKPSVLIPYPHSAGREQIRNAHHLADHGAAVVLAGPDATPENLHRALHPLLTDPHRRAAMSDAARALGHPNAADDLALALLDMAAPSLGPVTGGECEHPSDPRQPRRPTP
jgi:UDP-N-acetylglucosamine:LPS N-acetylglucosamine transferase